MHFYCFSTFFTSDFTGFSVSSTSSVVFSRRPSRSSNLVPRLAVVDGVLLAILADRQQPAN